MKILHITESYGAGVSSAIENYIRYSNDLDHYLFATIRKKYLTGNIKNKIFKDKELVDRNIFCFFYMIKFIKKVNPDIIHIHSSYAGFFIRVLYFFSSYKIVYTPHGYSFLRKDYLFLFRAFFYMIELILSFRTDVLAACSEDEKNKSANFFCKKIIVVPNLSGEVLSIIKYVDDPFPD